MQINTATLAALFKGYRVQYMEAYQAGAPMWDRVAMRTPSTAATEIYHWLGAVPGMKKLLDEIQIRNLTAHSYSITNDEFEDTVAVKQADIERDTYGIYNPLFSALGLSAKQHPDELVSNLLVNGFDLKCYTGKNFFDSNHEPVKGGTKFSNVGTKKLSAANFAAARTNIKSRLNAKGRPMNLGLKLLLVVSPQNEDLAKQILQADFIQQTAKNVAGNENIGVAAVSNTLKGSADLLVWPQLAAAPDAWFLLEAGYPIKPLILQVEKEATLTSLTNPDSDHVFKKHEFLYQAYGRYNAGYGLPELAYGSDGSQAA
ncbi:MAG TPA: Mu-like prophage major head subunit gpT family protein [Rariglobus sp.]|jgi:phage major head subunit gpT-like protein|nr:Mu-like prophage major head subunit gpT family protein [Rariglobus sp.]